MGTKQGSAYVAVDMGSSSGRIMLGTLRGTGAEGVPSAPSMTIREVARFANTPLRTAQGLSWDLDAFRRFLEAGLRDAVAAAAAEGSAIRGIGVDSWGVDYARLDEAGELRAFVRHHRDADPDLAAETSRGLDVGDAYERTGVLDQAINTAHQLRQDARAGIGSDGDTAILIADLVVHLLTGRVAAERTLASTTALLDRRDDAWSGRLLADYGAEVRLPELVSPGDFAGGTSPDLTTRIGAEAPLPVYYVTGHDTAAAFAAVTAAAPREPTGPPDGSAPSAGSAAGRSWGVVSCGSWAVVGLAVPQPILTSEARQRGFTQELGAEGDTLLVKNLSGMWLLQELTREWAAEDGLATWPLAALQELLAGARESPYRGRFDPADPSLQAPGDLSRRIGDGCEAAGHDRPRDRIETVRAVLVSLAAAYARALAEAAELAGTTVDAVRIVSGGSRNTVLCELTARYTGLPVVAGPPEASARGVLLQLAVAAGELPSLAVARTIDIDDGETAGHLGVPFRPEHQEDTHD
ncbi:rhamnulokinase [Leucobacter sp. CSA1]|uniref:Rhamnulokinase n=1 Tax=Leucobacter chromiisoli TaxID=2796471 RepID=A0A934Q6L0_9MICO|nr:FGGY-family carbohydrate kinase [Leucobacter chromiisoli]MBK0417532.1 rhamnulokinase [Leucobacter chromiisoli]